jgi:hypothetical protein
MIPARYLIVEVKPGETFDCPAEFVHAVHQIVCSHPDCRQMQPYCRDERHAEFWQVMGGSGAALTRVRESDGQEVRVHPVLSAEPTVPPPDPAAILDLNARIAARLAARKDAAR